MLRTKTIRAALLTACALGCSDGGGSAASVDPLVDRGRQVYQNVCVACHHGNPAVDGSLGPAIAGASRELLEAKVLRAEYPPGYTPKRPGGVTMPAFAYLAEEIDALAAYLAQDPPK